MFDPSNPNFLVDRSEDGMLQGCEVSGPRDLEAGEDDAEIGEGEGAVGSTKRSKSTVGGGGGNFDFNQLKDFDALIEDATSEEPRKLKKKSKSKKKESLLPPI